EPTYFYELDQAVKDKMLVPPVEIRVPTKFIIKGIRYHDLSEEEKAEYEDLFYDEDTGNLPDEISSTALNNWLFNADTVRKVLDHLLKNGQKIEGGDKLGKTIIFAKNHNHAKFIQDIFYKEFPGYGGAFLDVIDNYSDYALDLLDKFSDPGRMPQIAVSVDMLDTGVDIPEIVNLVFFKPVRSHSKFWQMIGRGTRLCPGLFGPGKDKQNFYIFDVCGNFEYFETAINKEEPGISESISQRIFNRRLRLQQLIKNSDIRTFEKYSTFRQDLVKLLLHEIAAIDTDGFAARPYLRQIHAFSSMERLLNLNAQDIEEIYQSIVPLLPPLQGDEAARRFDLLMINLMIARFEKLSGEEGLTHDLVNFATGLLKKTNIRAVSEKEEILRQLTEPEDVKNIDLPVLETIRLDLRDLAIFADGSTGQIVYSDFEDVLETDGSSVDTPPRGYADTEAYRNKVEHFLKQHKAHITISKLRSNKALTHDELIELERLIFDEGRLGTAEKFRETFGNSHPIQYFVRSIVGLEVSAARQAFSEFLSVGTMTSTQIRFIDILIDHLTVNGIIDKVMLVQPPFTDLSDKGVFGIFSDDQVGKIITIIDKINGNAEKVAG
ncbi:MAG TPA: type I restriction-modification enzyme R subunit C-terminal domain-containing protein, partial [Bacteroidales bacterium]|nr:type I restriction-modification enzyme R subunit C-terminal domain-containing protein [Bacteroidales bacterium]